MANITAQYYMPNPADAARAAAGAAGAAVEAFGKSFTATREIMLDREYKRVAQEELANVQNQLAEIDATISLAAQELEQWQLNGQGQAEVEGGAPAGAPAQAQAAPFAGGFGGGRGKTTEEVTPAAVDPVAGPDGQRALGQTAVEATRRIAHLTGLAQRGAQQKLNILMGVMAKNPDNKYIKSFVETLVEPIISGPKNVIDQFDQFARSLREQDERLFEGTQKAAERAQEREIVAFQEGQRTYRAELKAGATVEAAKVKAGASDELSKKQRTEFRAQEYDTQRKAVESYVANTPEAQAELTQRFPFYGRLTKDQMVQVETDRRYMERAGTEGLLSAEEVTRFEELHKPGQIYGPLTEEQQDQMRYQQEQLDTGSIPGILGRLWDLSALGDDPGKIKKWYDSTQENLQSRMPGRKG